MQRVVKPKTKRKVFRICGSANNDGGMNSLTGLAYLVAVRSGVQTTQPVGY